jgi:hypothetical protein
MKPLKEEKRTVFFCLSGEGGEEDWEGFLGSV